MPTFKVVVIGASGVGKTSLRGQFISGRFSTSYRATIGADFVTKTLPPILPSTEPVVLQIWDTAGQERFSSLSSAFFRGADAAILMYDVNSPDTLFALQKWWDEFKDKAPVAEGDIEDGRFCAVVVGNKVDLLEGKDDQEVVSPTQGARFVRALIPRMDTPPPTPGLVGSVTIDDDDNEHQANTDTEDPMTASQLTARPPSPKPISILRHPHLATNHRKTHSSSQISFSGALRQPRAHSSTRSRASSTITSTLTIFHTPSSSVFSDGVSEYYHSAQSSYSEPDLTLNGRSHSPSARSASELTITPARFSTASESSQSPTSLISQPNGKRSPPAPAPIDTSPFASSHKTAEERARDLGPSSAALSPLPYQTHLPFGAFEGKKGANGRQSIRTKGRETAAVSSASAGSSVESLSDNYLLEPDVDANSGAAAGHFRVSARTGHGVDDVFGWVARRLVEEWDRERREGEMRMEFGEAGDTIRARGQGRRRKALNGNGHVGDSFSGAEERLRMRMGNNTSSDSWGRCCQG
ncbi:Rab small monomeric GTPase [Mycena indigotica]|uniref:Rab small monomeric GTPase n=1 Tax=Mycena indigotica TaxID=2126181 RepID=A0A8H6S2D9_9AGAR|nr:Rab small monomeric GTPase [Mycena indigotica]KAF7290786.1 Rab small monomeric GTPase [Mycena indigotica]